VLNGRDHATPNGPFHWSALPDARFTIWRTAPGFDFAEGTHEAYGDGSHVRSVIALHDLGWLVVDHIRADGDVAADVWWHLHPSWTPSIRDHAVDLVAQDAPRLGFATTAADLSVIGPADASRLSGYAPEYGRIEPSYTLRASSRRRAPFCIVTFISASARRLEPLSLETAAADIPPGEGWTTCVARLHAPQLSLTALVATPANLRSSEPQKPTTIWCGAGVHTDARVAVVRTAAGAAPVASLVDGSRVEIEGTEERLTLATVVPAYHGGLRRALASAVHESARPELMNRHNDVWNCRVR
jgi:hypothetical protein